ncbi:MAG: carbamoyl-phosphate synthase large subunit [Methanothrix sp.]|uniref:Carbamoyl phosphate synthase large chain n=1 Tax=Methanothrix thermoacetophila (strain DSM 6194 / JCM 14653 / NBRC 101360 / PT) TaxID=349307 RepID=CARB_METTP|nr:carbamoyl-phosphate synthase large subunit [Methanothrix thermoacetophila]A0B8K9.1 RecName: Full=Carbamoyl phosphate synthase large chain; AltName: Full=Carbamoyl phosphate synthetase ammonia chain [Methanothrix thermoacetophila PT]ABK15033.1 carbamoyl-phosphate synthase large subunit [Methanothrix thermoacetophila PT]MBC7079384.1 carbamoyl-phosphate synthase large subunit [Methanothrix sp.]
MPKRSDIKKVLLIGSGPIQIGQAAEFDFSGSQACKSLREEGVEVVLVNSNPATIMTDPDMADKVYIEPLVPEIVAKIIEKERPDGIIAGIGGQTGLNITSELAEMGVLEKYGVEVLGTKVRSIQEAEDRDLFKKAMERIGEPVPRSIAVTSLEEAEEAMKELGLPLIVRPAYTLGGSGGGVARTHEELMRICEMGLKRSRIHQVLLEESVIGWTEVEYEVMRDSNNTCITICNMENMDPMGIHTGESIVVTPIQTLSDHEIQMLRSAAINIIRALGIEGGCNIQFAVRNGEYRVIEVNPRVSRSSALASKATGYPIARVTAKIAIGLTLDEIRNDVTKETPASFEPTVDYVVIKIPRWPFDKFVKADRTLTTSMKSTGEVMAIGRSYEEALMKAIRSLDIDIDLGYNGKYVPWTDDDVRELLRTPTDERLFAIYQALRRGFSVEEISQLSMIDPYFIERIQNIIRMEDELKNGLTPDRLRRAKKMGFLDSRIAELVGLSREEVTDYRLSLGIIPTYKMVDTCAAEFAASTPYYYSTYDEECELNPSDNKKVLILGSGPIRIGQGIEFDYCTVHAVTALREMGIEAHIINNNPETVSTDYDTSDKLFFEPVTLEDVMNVIEKERYWGVMVQFGGQTAVNLAVPLEKELKRRGLKTVILGTSPDSIDIAEDRERFNKLLNKLGIPQPKAGIAYSPEEAKRVAKEIGYPVLVRPSYVLGGRAMEIVYDESGLELYMREAVRVSHEHPVLIDDFLQNAVEIDVDAVSDGRDVLIGAIMEHIEEAGIHSGDSACMIPPQTLPEDVIATVKDYVRRIALALDVKGIINIQMAYKDGIVYVLEANPRSSRTIPFVSKAVGLPLAKIAAKVMAGNTLREMNLNVEPEIPYVAVKEVLLPFDKLPGADVLLGPEMRSTGEVMGIDYNMGLSFFKAEMSAENNLPLDGIVFISVRDEDKAEIAEVARRFVNAGLKIIATDGTSGYLRGSGVPAERVRKIYHGSPNVLDYIRRGEVKLIINTPTTKQSVKDGFQIRRSAVDYHVPYITTVQAAKAAAEAIEKALRGELTIKALDEYHREVRYRAL